MQFTQKSQELAQQLNTEVVALNLNVDENQDTFLALVEKVLNNNQLKVCDENLSKLCFTWGWMFA